MRKRSEAGAETKELERTPEGTITNCSLANGGYEEGCQVCRGKCPDKAELVEAEVIKISGQLRDEVRKEAEKPPGGYKFPVVQRSARDAKLRDDFAKIVETVWIEDMHEAWTRIRAALKVGEKRSQHGHLHRALDDARELSYEAHQLFITAKLEHKRWKNANEVTHGGMWAEATRALQHEKDTGLRSKQITDADVRAKVASLYPDEWAAQELDREKAELLVDNMAQLAKDANGKCADLAVMLSKLRG